MIKRAKLIGRNDNGNWEILNPVNNSENFADSWNNTNNKKSPAFFEWIEKAKIELIEMTNIILSYNGTIDKFVGDEIMALFGAPVFYNNHCDIAIKVAIEMQKQQEYLIKKWLDSGKKALKMGIGINTGNMVIGNIGCSQMMDYTVIGNSVNLGARLCSAASGGEILISENTYNNILEKNMFKYTEKEPISVKGISDKVNIYSVAE